MRICTKAGYNLHVSRKGASWIWTASKPGELVPIAYGYEWREETAQHKALSWVDHRLNEIAYYERQNAQDAAWHREQAALEHERNHCDKPEDYI
jgi:hypothetical protein